VNGVAEDLISHFGVPAGVAVHVPWPALPPGDRAPAPRPVIVIAGHVDGIMGLELLLQTAHLLRQQDVPAEVTLYGGGPLLQAARQVAIAMDVPMKVFSLTLETARDLAGGGVFHAPQWLDGTGWHLVQAARVGLPLTAVSAPEAALEVTRRGTLGKLVGLGDLEGLKAALTPLLTDEATWRGYHQGALTLGEAHDPGHVAPAWLELFTTPYGPGAPPAPTLP
jgi:glycosyltransferase involved in cell wall biosynthesis